MVAPPFVQVQGFVVADHGDEICEMPADYDLWGEPGYDPDAYGGGGYD